MTLRVLTVPNWSFGRDTRLLRLFEERLNEPGLTVHYLQSDVDHNRTVSAFSGEQEVIKSALLDLCALAFPSIDLNRHVGVHPRIGALDVCPFVPLGRVKPKEFKAWIEDFGVEIAEKFDLPVFLYEKSERGRHEADLPALRKGGFGALLERELHPDFGPPEAHRRLGATVTGWRDPLIAMNIDLAEPDPSTARALAKTIRQERREGDPRFLGVRALGLPLPSRQQSQISMNVTLPDITPVDPIIEWVYEQCVARGVRVIGPELVGVLRDVDAENTTRLPFRPEQVVATR
ncbi:MAG TPA: hypothetical protein VNI20_08215 [Fimbriimonadaceae bacterium]|nr:hypothetical protein [Fimbriimonadaceae bacterium]